MVSSRHQMLLHVEHSVCACCAQETEFSVSWVRRRAWRLHCRHSRPRCLPTRNYGRPREMLIWAGAEVPWSRYWRVCGCQDNPEQEAIQITNRLWNQDPRELEKMGMFVESDACIGVKLMSTPRILKTSIVLFGCTNTSTSEITCACRA